MTCKERVGEVLKWAGAALIATLAYLCVLPWLPAVCPVRRLTGLYCPGCGASRMCLRLLRLDFAGAFRANSLLLLAAPVILGTLGSHVGRYIRRGVTKTPRWENGVWWTLVVLFALYGVGRNLPGLAFLAPR